MKIKLKVRTQTKNQQLKPMNIYKNDPKYKVSYTSKKHTFLSVRNLKIRKYKKNTKSHILEILIKSIQSRVNPVYDRADRRNLHQFQSYTM